MVIIFRPNVLILINIFINISQILGKIFCRHRANVSVCWIHLASHNYCMCHQNMTRYIPSLCSFFKIRYSCSHWEANSGMEDKD